MVREELERILGRIGAVFWKKKTGYDKNLTIPESLWNRLSPEDQLDIVDFNYRRETVGRGIVVVMVSSFIITAILIALI